MVVSSVADLVRERFGELTSIQKLAIPSVLAGKNVLILAPTGSGKCVSGDTVIFTKDGPDQIQNLYRQQVEVNSLDQKLRVGFSKGLVIQKKKSKLFNLTTDSGRQVKVTDDHKFLTLNDGVLEWRMLKSLNEGDYVACARKIPIVENNDASFNLQMFARWGNIGIKIDPRPSELIRAIKEKRGRIGLRKIAPLIDVHRATLMMALKNYNISVSTYLRLANLAGYSPEKIRITEIGGAGAKTLKVPKMDEDFAYFTGLFAGDGNFNHNNLLRFTTSSQELLAFFTCFCSKLGLATKKDKSRKYDYYVCSKSLYVLLNSLGLKDKNKSATIRIPSIFFRKLSVLAAFIRGLFDTDGSVSSSEIKYCTKSEQMAKDLQLALLCFGILSRLRIKKHVKYGLYYRIFVSGSENVFKFVSLIGFGHQKKLLRAKNLSLKSSNPNKDIIPNIASCVKACAVKLHIPYKRICNYKIIQSYMYGLRRPSVNGLKKTIMFLSNFGQNTELDFLKKLADSDIFWDKVTQIDSAGDDYVYDATVPGNSNFVGNGLILHNTESALLPILERIKTSEERIGIRALYITPLRALSRDLKQRFNWWCDRLEITHDIRTGDTTQAERARHRAKPPQVLLTTVESLQALLLGKIMRRHLSTVQFVIVDEIHDILDNKRGAQLSLGLERLNEIAKFQRIGISATVANESEAGKLLFGDRESHICETGKNRKMDFSVESLSNDKRLEKIKELSEKFRSLIFVNTRSTAEEVGASLKKMNAPIGVHHGSLAKEVRLTTEDDFKNGKINSILCTSSLELGIDVGDVSLVMQYGSPHQVFRLIQRVGRSGHSLEKTPKGIIFSSDFDDNLESEVITVLATNGWMEDKKTERGALDVIAHQMVGLCLDFGRMELSQIHSILSRSYAYGIDFNKLRMIALQLYGEGLIYYDETPNQILIKTKPRARIYYSDFLSTIPKTKKFLLRDISSNKFISSLDEEFVVNLESSSSFLSHGLPWRVIDITEKEVLAEPTSGMDIMVPSWTGEDIPVSFDVAQEVGKMRAVKEISPLPDHKTIVIEIVEDLVVVHCCFGTKVNEAISRVFSKQLSNLIGESVVSVCDPYRVLIKLPFPMKEEYIKHAFENVKHIRSQLSDALEHSSLLKFKFLHVARMFGLLSVDGTLSSRYIQMLRNSVVYEETIRSIFFRYFDVEKTEELLHSIRSGKLKIIYDIRKKPSFFAQIGLERMSGAETLGAFEPRERIISAFKENTLSKTLRLICLNCKVTRFMHLASAPEKIVCHKCNQPSLALVDKEGEAKHDLEFSAGLISAYGKQALIALSTYGIGPQTADRVLRRLHKTEEAFYLDLIEAQKNFIKNKKYWKLQ